MSALFGRPPTRLHFQSPKRPESAGLLSVGIIFWGVLEDFRKEHEGGC